MRLIAVSLSIAILLLFTQTSTAQRRLNTGWIGAHTVSVDKELAKQLNLRDSTGQFISVIDDDSPADRAGLKAGDIILNVTGKANKPKGEVLYRVTSIIYYMTPGTSATVTIVRNGIEMDLVVKVSSLVTWLERKSYHSKRNKNVRSKKKYSGDSLVAQHIRSLNRRVSKASHGRHRDPPDAAKKLERELYRLKYATRMLQSKLRALSSNGKTAFLFFGNCDYSGIAHTVCARLYTVDNVRSFPLRIWNKALQNLADNVRLGLQVTTAELALPRSVRTYLEGIGNHAKTVSEDYRSRSEMQDELGCDAKELQCVSQALFPKRLREALTGIEHLVVLPIGSIGALPLAAFPFGGERLIDKMTITIAPDLRVILYESGKYHSELRGRSIVIADPDLSNDPHHIQERLLGAHEEGRYVANQLNSKLLVGAEASLKKVKSHLQNESSQFSLIYFATHGASNAVDPMDKSVLLLSGGDITGQDIKNLRLKGNPLVVMSACQTGLGKTFPGGMFGLAQAWMHAGAGAVLMSLWDIDDKATTILMKNFVDKFKSGLPAEVALARAMRKLKYMNLGERSANNDAYRTTPFMQGTNPTLWSGFALYGPPTPLRVR